MPCFTNKKTAALLKRLFGAIPFVLWGILLKKRFESVCKPSSVVYGHLSRLTVTDKLKRCSRYSVGRTALLTETQSCSEWGLHGILCYHNIGELLPRLSILTANGQNQTVHSRQSQAVCGGLFLLHYPGGHPRLTLSGTLSYAARTFLIIISDSATV